VAKLNRLEDRCQVRERSGKRFTSERGIRFLRVEEIDEPTLDALREADISRLEDLAKVKEEDLHENEGQDEPLARILLEKQRQEFV
jgi:hypothetical protein